MAAANARSRSEIHDVVRCPHRVFVVLDDDHRVALVAEAGEGRQQAGVVAGVQSDRRFVEDVEHADQPAADLPGQPDPLHFAARKGRRGAVQREVLQPHVPEELQPAADFLDRLGGDLLAGGVQIEPGEDFVGVGNRQAAQGRQRKLRRGKRTSPPAWRS